MPNTPESGDQPSAPQDNPLAESQVTHSTPLDAELLATAYHEAGHAVMAAILGRNIQKVTIKSGQMQTGGVRLGVCELAKGRSRASQDEREDEVLILLAGMVAESKFTGQYCKRGASQDLRHAESILRDRAGNDSQLLRLHRRMLDKTEHILADPANAKAIELVANELIGRTTIRGRTVRHILDQLTSRKS